MPNKKITKLLQQRETIKTTLTNLKTFGESFNSETIDNGGLSQLRVRKVKLDSLWDRYELYQTELELNEFEEYGGDREAFEGLYFDTQAIYDCYLNNNSTINNPNSNTYRNSETSTSETKNVKLPEFKIPTFCGDISEWINFRDMFKSCIGTDTSLTDVQKLYYLKSLLSGEAVRIISALKNESDSYTVAWKLLEDRYDDKHLIINTHINAILNIQGFSKFSSIVLRNMISSIKQHLGSLKNMLANVNDWDPLIIQIILHRVDFNTKREWEMKVNKNELPTLNQLFEFLEKKCKSNEVLEKPQITQAKNAKSINYLSINNNQGQNSNKPKICKICNKESNHSLFNCSKFLESDVNTRIGFVKQLGVCYNCLKPNHNATSCRSGSCKQCKRRHNSLLHLEKVVASSNEGVNNINITSNPSNNQTDEQTLINTTNTISHNLIENLLPTIKLRVRDSFGNWHISKALLDQGAQSCLITQSFANILGSNIRPTQTTISGVGGKNGAVQGLCKINISSLNHLYNESISCFVIDKITSRLPNKRTNTRLLNMPSNISLADPEFDQPSEVHLLLGCELFASVLKSGFYKSSTSNYILQETVFGWVISGQVPVFQEHSQSIQSFFVQTQSLHDNLSEFWKMEELPSHLPLTKNERYCEEHFISTTTRRDNGQFVVTLPLSGDPRDIGDSFQTASKRFYALERKLHANPPLFEQYSNFIHEYLDLGHMEVVQNFLPSTVNCEKEYYLPHHAVLKDSTTTKLRVVFDASATGSNGKSLNDILHPGPTIQQTLFSIIIRFRTFRFAFSADVEKMFRMVEIDPDQCDLQRILWRVKQDDPLQCYRLKTVTYGTTCAPYLATKCLQYLAQLEGSNYPQAATVLTRDCYMDDILSGGDNLDHVLNLQKQLISLLQQGGFHLRKWCSNNEQILASVDPADRETNLPLQFNDKSSVKTLGLLWFPAEDNFSVHINLNKFNDDELITKRRVLSDISRLFDPLGLLGPVVVRAKLFIQELWKLNLGWDDPLPDELTCSWLKFKRELPLMATLEIPRRIISLNRYSYLEAHGFCDSSQIAYGACIYLKAVDDNGEISVHNICAKSRVAPVRPITIPRLELCSAVLLARLVHDVISVLNLEIKNVFLWSDSMIVLAWLKASPNKWSAFVANRVALIQELTSSYQWNYVPTNSNPADLLTRGLAPSALQGSSLWWKGPEWLFSLNIESFMNYKLLNSIEIPEQRSQSSVHATIKLSDDFDTFYKFSSFNKIQRVIAYCLRFIHNVKVSKNLRRSDQLTTLELRDSLHVLIRLVQREGFYHELDFLKKGKPLPKNSPILSLNPFMDKDGIIRVGGRLKNSSLSYSAKFPMLLPTHYFTELLIKHEHLRLLHAGNQCVLNNIRSRFWPINAKRTIRRVIHSCIVCFKQKRNQNKQLMGDLPHYRVTPSRPFLYTGLDYAGPFLLRTNKLRKSTFTKAYVSIFICLCTRAIHIELVSDLTSEAFLAALKRFTSRRGICSHIYSDNATTFKGASNELSKIREFLREKGDTISNSLANNGIQFHFIPPYSPHFGGIWEAGVKSIKFHMKRVIGETKLTYEEMATILTQIEACLNSRPLTSLPSDLDPYPVLTPSHFLIGEPHTSIPSPDLTHQSINRLTRWQMMQKFSQDIWKRWSSEYLHNLQQRTKWKERCINLSIGDVVVIKSESPLSNWTMARVVELHPGQDGLVRVASIKNANGEIYKRHINKLCKLPIQEDTVSRPQDVQRS